MDGIREQLVKRPRSSSDSLKTAMVLMASLALAAVVFGAIYVYSRGLLTAVGLIAAGLILCGGWWLSGNFNVEYEYIVCGDELQIDKIINKRSRKTLCSMKLRSAETFYKSEKHISGATEIDVCGEGEKYSVEYSDPVRGKTVIIFTPDERTLEAIKRYLPRAI